VPSPRGVRPGRDMWSVPSRPSLLRCLSLKTLSPSSHSPGDDLQSRHRRWETQNSAANMKPRIALLSGDDGPGSVFSTRPDDRFSAGDMGTTPSSYFQRSRREECGGSKHPLDEIR
jgi:hypothetical protein